MYAQLQEHETRISERVQRYHQAYVQHAEATTSATHRHPVVAAAVAQLQQVMQGAGWGANNIACVMRDVRKQAGNTSSNRGSSSRGRLDTNINRSNTAWGTAPRRRRPTAAAAAAAAVHDEPFGSSSSSSSGPRADYTDEQQPYEQHQQQQQWRSYEQQQARQQGRSNSSASRQRQQQQQQEQDDTQRESDTGAGAAGPMPRQEFEASHLTVTLILSYLCLNAYYTMVHRVVSQ
jgi:hypothetical protein